MKRQLMTKARMTMMLVSIAAAVMLFGVGCGGDDGDELTGEIQIAGSSTVYPISMAVAEEFSKLYPGIKVSVSSTGTGGGFKNFFIPGKTDINDASRPIKPSEIEKCLANNIIPLEIVVGIDALSIVTNKNSAVDSMTFTQLKKIFGPASPPSRWNQVSPNWPDAEFELFGPASTSGTFDYFTETVVGQGGSHRSDYHKTEHDNVIVQGIAGNKYALGYFGFAYYISNKDRLKALAIDNGSGNAVKPSLENAQSGAYPLSRPLFIYVSSKGLDKPHVKKFVEFYIRQCATELVSQVGYVPITEKQMKENLAKIGVK